jgi:2,3-bisphosphoglycerate-independent phosphoglycerate mutase
MKKPPLVLIVLDGWGCAPPSKANAISLARTPNYDSLMREFPSTRLHASGRDVGLPKNQIGNSEVGHLNIGSGRVVYMDITKIDLMIENGDFFSNPVLMEGMKNARQGGRQLHVCGLLSDGGVHSRQEHLHALLRMAKEQGVERTFVHCFMDGRDTSPTGGADYLQLLQHNIREYGTGKIASVGGRYYGMDRDAQWDRVLKAFEAMVHGNGEGGQFVDPIQGVKESYERGVTDEFIIPFVCVDNRGEPLGLIRNEDTVINFNFRADRARQITRSLARESGLTVQGGRELFDAASLDSTIPRSRIPKNLKYVCMTQYNKQFTLPYVVQPNFLKNILANVMAEHDLLNLRIAETEKYAHVTYFFNGGVEKAFKGEERKLIPSAKVATYDLKPEMSAAAIAQSIVKNVNGSAFDIILANFANADMVGHSGKIPPTVQAVETVDICIGEVYNAVRRRGGSMLITADHGNAEMMIDPATGGPHTAHTTNPVPFILISEDAKRCNLRSDGSLQDISPTILGMLGIDPPKEMTGHDLRRVGYMFPEQKPEQRSEQQSYAAMQPPQRYDPS